jgi:SNF2 family DNA or RNA helicase
MLLDINQSILVLDTKEKKISFDLQAQLEFLGFKTTINNIFSKEKYNLDLIEKVIKIIEAYGISLELSELVNQKIKDLKKNQEEHNAISNYLYNLKNGDIIEEDYTKYLKLLDGFHRNLYDHQKKASFHLFKAKHAANFSVPGSGKTTVVLAVYNALKNLNLVDAILVVGPLSSHGSWLTEWEECFDNKPDHKILSKGSINKRKQIYLSDAYSELNLTTFQSTMFDCEYLKEYISHAKFMLVIDEAHYIKRSDSRWASSILDLGTYSSYRVVLTGTPMPQSYKDLFNLFDFLYLDESPLSLETKTTINSYAAQDDPQTRLQAEGLLEDTIGPFFYRVRKVDLNLSAQNEYIIKVKMNKYERIIYEFIITEIQLLSNADYEKNRDFVNTLKKGRMMRLRQSYSNISLLKSTIEGYDENMFSSTDVQNIISKYDSIERPAKLETLIDLIKTHYSKNEKVVIWSNFIGTIELIEKEIKKMQIYCSKIIGQTPATNDKNIKDMYLRKEIVQEFNDPKGCIQVIIANPAACAESISLHKDCNHAIYYDLSYNCAQYLQSLDRIHRVGGSEDIESHYYFLSYDETHEDEIFERVKDKADRMKNVMDIDYGIYDLDMDTNDDDIEAYDNIIEGSS